MQLSTLAGIMKVIEEGLLKGTPIPPGDIALGIGIPKRGKHGPIAVNKSAAEMRKVAKKIDKARIWFYAIVHFWRGSAHRDVNSLHKL